VGSVLTLPGRPKVETPLAKGARISAQPSQRPEPPIPACARKLEALGGARRSTRQVRGVASSNSILRHLGRWVPCKYIQGAASIQVYQLAALEPDAIAEPA
jgi:hypothetical protein